MAENKPVGVFDDTRAASYDKRFSKLSPMKDALHLLMRMVLSDLPTCARVLVVGAGTGAELLSLAEAFPQWRFTVLDPSAPMLDICRKRVDERGIASRCTFHTGYLDTLPESEPFDAATSILVSHFLTDLEARRDFFHQIAARLRPGGRLVSADLASDMSTATFASLFQVWVQMLKHAEMPPEEVEKFRASFGKKVAVLPPEDIASLITSSGFEVPVRFFQTLLIHGWFARLTHTDS